MSLEFEVLPNGAALVADSDPTARSVALGVFVRAGSQDERRSEWGAAHFLEHIVFKGAGALDREAIARTMDQLGGDVNAFTTRELTCYHAHLLDRDLLPGFRLLWTLISDPWIREEDVEVERGVVREEQRDARDDPEDRAEQAFLAALWGSHPLARDVLGTPASLQRVTAGTLRQFWAAWYRPETLTVSVAGRVAPDVLAEMRDLMAAWRVKTPRRSPPGPPVPVGGEARVRVPGELVHIMAGWPAPPWSHPEAAVARCLAVAFGGQNSSRLWQRIREQDGLAYHVGATYTGHATAGDIVLSAAAGAEHVGRVVTAMAEEWRDMRRGRPLSQDEVDRAKRQLEASLAFGWETPEGRMHWMARFALERRRPVDPADSLNQIEQVRRDDVLAMVARLTDPGTPFAFAVAGPRRALSPGLMETFTAIARADKPVKEVGEVGR